MIYTDLSFMLKTLHDLQNQTLFTDPLLVRYNPSSTLTIPRLTILTIIRLSRQKHPVLLPVRQIKALDLV